MFVLDNSLFLAAAAIIAFIVCVSSSSAAAVFPWTVVAIITTARHERCKMRSNICLLCPLLCRLQAIACACSAKRAGRCCRSWQALGSS